MIVGSAAEPGGGDSTLLNGAAFRVAALNEKRRRDGSANGVVRSFSLSFLAGIIVACPGIVDVVRVARKHATVSVLTNKGRRPSVSILEGLGMRDLFEEVIGGDGPLPRKPDPASLLALMDRAGAAPSTTLMVGDSPIDHETAHRAGARCCLAAYGFGYERFTADRLPPDEWVVQEPAGIIDVIERFVDAE